jgi:hypothetical protein
MIYLVPHGHWTGVPDDIIEPAWRMDEGRAEPAGTPAGAVTTRTQMKSPRAAGTISIAEPREEAKPWFPHSFQYENTVLANTRGFTTTAHAVVTDQPRRIPLAGGREEIRRDEAPWQQLSTSTVSCRPPATLNSHRIRTTFPGGLVAVHHST